MVKDLYQKSEQRIYFQREQTYGEIYDPEAELTAFTSIPDDYPHWRRLDLIPEATDISVPFIEKLKKYDISAAKHPSHIFSGNYEPSEFTVEFDAQGLEFLAFAIGAPVHSSGTRAMTQTIACTAEGVTGVVQGDYFLFDVIDSGGNIDHYGVWIDTAGDGSTGKPVVTGINASKMLAANISGSTPASTSTQVADAIELIIETTLGGGGTSDITSADNVANLITLIHARSGAVQPAHDGEAATLFTFGVTTFGASTYTISEDVGYALPSFTMRVEQRNAGDATEDIIYDLFGCVIDSITVNVDFGEKIVKASVTIKCPYVLENTTHGRADIAPPHKGIAAFPTMSALKEATDAVLLQSLTTATINGAGDITPKQVDKVTFSIKNNVTFRGDVSIRYKNLAVAGKREVEMNVIGETDDSELYKFWQETYKLAGADWIPNAASDNIHTTFKLQRDATYDYISLHVYNWLISNHNLHFVDVDEAVKVIDMIVTDGSADTNGRIIDSCSIVSPIDQCIMTYNV